MARPLTEIVNEGEVLGVVSGVAASVPVGGGGGVAVVYYSQPVDGATRASATLGPLNTPWTDSITVDASQAVRYVVNPSMQCSANTVMYVALSRNGTIIDRRYAGYEGSGYEARDLFSGIDSPGAGTHTYEVIVASSTGTITLNTSVDTSTAGATGADGVSSMMLEAVTTA